METRYDFEDSSRDPLVEYIVYDTMMRPVIERLLKEACGNAEFRHQSRREPPHCPNCNHETQPLFFLCGAVEPVLLF